MNDDDLIIGPKIDPYSSQELEKKLRPLFKGYHPRAQGTCLASLTALFVAGHVVEGDAAKTKAVREQIIRMHLQTILEMIPEAEEQIRESKKQDAARTVS